MRHVPSAYLAVILLGIVAAVVFWAIKPTGFTAELAAIAAIPAALCGAAGGIVSIVMGAPEPTKEGVMLPPEVAGMKIFFRSAWPVIIAVLGSVPVVVAHRVEEAVADGKPGSPLGAASTAALFAVVLAAFVVAYVRYRDRAKQWFAATMEESARQSKERQAARAR